MERRGLVGCEIWVRVLQTNFDHGLMYVFILLLIFTNFIGPAVHIRGKGLFMTRLSQGYGYKLMKQRCASVPSDVNILRVFFSF